MFVPFSTSLENKTSGGDPFFVIKKKKKTKLLNSVNVGACAWSLISV